MDEERLEAVRQLVRSSPYAWAGLLLALATIYIAARLGTWLAIGVASLPLRVYRGDSWSERARRTWPVRKSSGLALLLLGFPAGLLLSPRFPVTQVLPPWILIPLGSTAGLAGVIRSSIGAERRINPAYPLTPEPERGVWISWILVFLPIVVLMGAFVWILPDRMGPLAAAELTLLAILAGLYLGHGRLAALRALGVMRPASGRVAEVVERASARVGIAPRAVELIGLPMANAFAFTLEQRIGFTDAAVAVLDDGELTAIAAHELAHLTESRAVRWARASQSFLLGFFLAMLAGATKPLMGSYSAMGLCLGGLAGSLTLIAGLKLLQLMSRRMEHRADAHGAGGEAAAGVYARALEKIHRTSMLPAVFPSRKMTHPHLYDRMLDAGLTPEFPRPAPPSRGTTLAGAACLLAVAFAGVQGFWYTSDELPLRLLDRPAAAFWRSGACTGDFSDYRLLYRMTKVPGPEVVDARATASAVRYAGNSRGTAPGGGSPSSSR